MGGNEGDLSTGIPKAPDISEDGSRWIVCLVFGAGNDDTSGLNEREPDSGGILGQGESGECEWIWNSAIRKRLPSEFKKATSAFFR